LARQHKDQKSLKYIKHRYRAFSKDYKITPQKHPYLGGHIAHNEPSDCNMVRLSLYEPGATCLRRGLQSSAVHTEGQ